MTRGVFTKMDGSFNSSIKQYSDPSSHQLPKTRDLFLDTTVDGDDENFPFILSVPQINSNTNAESHRSKLTLVGTHRRVIKKYSLQLRCSSSSSNNNNNLKDIVGYTSPSPNKMKEPSLRVLLSGYNKILNQENDEEPMVMASININNDENLIIDTPPPLCFSPPRRRRLNQNDDEKLLSDDLPKVSFLSRRPPPPLVPATFNHDEFVTPKQSDVPFVNLDGSPLPFLPTLS